MRHKNILEVTDLSSSVWRRLIKRSIYFGKNRNKNFSSLRGKQVGLFFDSASLRTKLSFEIATHKLGGFPYFMDIHSVTHEDGETRESFGDIIDTADRFVDMYVVRDYSRKILDVLKRDTFPPVINGFSVVGHPSQALADLAVITREKGDVRKLSVCAVCPAEGSGVIESFVYGVLLLDGNVTLITPTGKFVGKNDDFRDVVGKLPGKLYIEKDPRRVIKKADVLYVDEWWWPGSDFLKKRPSKKYRVDRDFLKDSKADLIILHCLPAHHNREISEQVILSKKSLVFDEAEFRVYSAMALMEYLAEGVSKPRKFFSQEREG